MTALLRQRFGHAQPTMFRSPRRRSAWFYSSVPCASARLDEQVGLRRALAGTGRHPHSSFFTSPSPRASSTLRRRGALGDESCSSAGRRRCALASASVLVDGMVLDLPLLDWHSGSASRRCTCARTPAPLRCLVLRLRPPRWPRCASRAFSIRLVTPVEFLRGSRLAPASAAGPARRAGIHALSSKSRPGPIAAA